MYMRCGLNAACLLGPFKKLLTNSITSGYYYTTEHAPEERLV